jgi:hypothetical protein
VGGVRDLGEEAVVLFRTGDPFDLAAKIQGIASDRAGWDAKVARARAWAEGHDLHWTVDQLSAVIDRVSGWS